MTYAERITQTAATIGEQTEKIGQISVGLAWSDTYDASKPLYGIKINSVETELSDGNYIYYGTGHIFLFVEYEESSEQYYLISHHYNIKDYNVYFLKGSGSDFQMWLEGEGEDMITLNAIAYLQ